MGHACMVINSLAGQPPGSTAPDVLHHQHAERGSGDLGRLFKDL